MNYISLDLFDLAFAALLVLVNGVISVLFSLGIARALVVAALRMCVQLAAVGLVLRYIFAQSALWMVVLIATIMVVVAGYEAMSRQKFRFKGFWGYGVGAAGLFVAGFTTIVFALLVVLKPEPWYLPRYALPILGMILGNILTAVALGLNSLLTNARRERPAIEARLALGATWSEASNAIVREALQTALMPIINTMAVIGIVALPGMMTGQILAGVEPLEAVKYQIVIIFLIAGATALGALIAVLIANRRLSDDRQRLRLDRIRAKN
jgi:UDP-glucose/iron transport system permease protein